MAIIQRGFYPILKIYIFNQLDFLRNSSADNSKPKSWPNRVSLFKFKSYDTI